MQEEAARLGCEIHEVEAYLAKERGEAESSSDEELKPVEEKKQE